MTAGADDCALGVAIVYAEFPAAERELYLKRLAELQFEVTYGQDGVRALHAKQAGRRFGFGQRVCFHLSGWPTGVGRIIGLNERGGWLVDTSPLLLFESDMVEYGE